MIPSKQLLPDYLLRVLHFVTRQIKRWSRRETNSPSWQVFLLSLFYSIGRRNLIRFGSNHKCFLHFFRRVFEFITVGSTMCTTSNRGADSRIIITATAAAFLPHVTSAEKQQQESSNHQRDVDFFYPVDWWCGHITIPPARVHKFNHACNLFAHASHHSGHKDNLMTTTTVFQSRQHTTADSSIHWPGARDFSSPKRCGLKTMKFCLSALSAV